jgi:two-component system response regulator AtoC
MPDIFVETARVLVVSREIALLRPLWLLGESNAWKLETASTGWEAMERVQTGVAPHLLVLDIPKGDGDSTHILRWLRRLQPELRVIVVYHSEDAKREKEALSLGAEAVLVRPFDENELEGVIRRHLNSAVTTAETKIDSENVEAVGDDEFFLTVSPLMQKVRAQAELLGQADVPVLILGEPGSGKAIVARLIHKLSIHSGFDFQRVNCAAIPDHLLEIELFGSAASRDGAPGSQKLGAGKIGRAERGTLLLEEITEMPLNLQAKLMRVLQQEKFAAGEVPSPGYGTRILATSSAKLDRALAEKRLREDLYYRLSAFTVQVPPLRQRKEEINILLQYAMHKIARHYDLPPRDFTPAVLEACIAYSWPGNLPGLETFVKRYLVAGEQDPALIEKHPVAVSSRVNEVAANLPSTLSTMPLPTAKNVDALAQTQSLKSLIENVKTEAEKNAIAAALEKTGWNRKAAARLLKVSYRTLLYKIERYRMTASQPYMAPFSENRLMELASANKTDKVS